MTDEEMCPCGRPLHYGNPDLQAAIQDIIALQGTHIFVAMIANPNRGWSIPRHFIALHDVQGHELEEAAHRYGFEEIGI